MIRAVYGTWKHYNSIGRWTDTYTTHNTLEHTVKHWGVWALIKSYETVLANPSGGGPAGGAMSCKG